MFVKKNFFVVGIVLAVFAVFLAGTAIADTDRDLVRNSAKQITKSRGSLDEDYTELRYLKTTNYGQTWTTFQQAGNVGTFSPSATSFYDFSAIVMNNNELCYVVVLENAATPGVYSVSGPAFTPVLIVANTDVTWTDVGKLPNGDLIAIMWGQAGGTTNTFWAAKSTNNGATWGAPWVIATEPALPPGSGPDADLDIYPHISDLNSADNFFVLFQTTGESGFDQHVLRTSAAGGSAGQVTSLGTYSAVYFSYYTGNCKPIGYDPAANALYVCFRNTDASATAVYYSNNQGVSFSASSIPGAQRYPSMAMNLATETPWVFSNGGPPSAAGEHCAWNSHDEFGYGGGAWTDRNLFTCIPYDGSTFWLFYMNQGYWWDADHGVVSNNRWGSFTPDGINATYTTDGGTTWAPTAALYHYETDGIDAGTVQNAELVGGLNGVAYIVTCGMSGITDTEGPEVAGTQLVTPATSPGPWVVKGYITDNVMVDGPDWVRLEYMYNPLDAGEYYGLWGGEGGGADSCQGCEFQQNNSGWYFFTLPAQHRDGYTWVNGDTVWFVIHATDPPGNSGYGLEQAIVVGQTWLGVEGEAPAAADFRLIGNYPNPFNPATRIEFTLPADLRVTMKVYNTLGQEVATLLNNRMLSGGLHAYTFDASDLASGVYIYTLEAGSHFDARKMVLMK